MTNCNPKLSFVIPCFNEEVALCCLLKRVSAVGKLFAEKYEIILVDDGSTDNSWNRMVELAGIYPELVLVKLSRNYGHQLALSAGLSVVKSTDYTMILDADLQDPPEVLMDMLKLMHDENADVVYGQRNIRKGETFFKLVTAKIFYRILRFMTDIDIPPDTGDFRLIKRNVLDVFLKMPEHARFIRGMISWIGFKQVAYCYDRDKRFAGQTKYPLKKMMNLAFDAITSFSVKPLRLGVLSGIFGFLIGIILLCYCLTSYFLGETVSGWTSTTAIIIIIGSWQFLLLGLIGEYLGRVFIEAQNRPLYIIEKIVSDQ